MKIVGPNNIIADFCFISKLSVFSMNSHKKFGGNFLSDRQGRESSY